MEGKKPVKYSDEQREAALLLMKEIGITKAAKELHIAELTLRNWRRNAELSRHAEEQPIPDNGTNQPSPVLSEQEPPVVRIETVVPDPSDTLQESSEDKLQGKDNTTDKKVETPPSEHDGLIDQLRSENAELKLRIGLLKKALAGIVEAVASL